MLFADTSYLIALFRSYDDKHERAVEIADHLGDRLLTTQHVLSEFITFISSRDGNKVAYEIGKQMMERDMPIIASSHEDILSALEFVRTYPQVSMCDAISAAVMQKLGLTKVLSFDSDFDRMGFERIS